MPDVPARRATVRRTAWRGWARTVTGLLMGAMVVAASAASAPVPVRVPSLDRDAAGQPVGLPGFWWPAPAGVATPGSAPAVVLLHGCGGAYNAAGGLSRRLSDYADWLQARGLAVLVVDSLSPRGERELCTQRVGQRQVTQAHRLRDALGALQWLGAQPGVDAARLGLMGWSNGGSTVLAASNLQHPAVAAAPVKPAFAVAFYPGCVEALRQGYRPAAPLLMLLGAADDWTPAAPCQALAAAHPAAVQAEVFDGAYHGFDSHAPVRHRPDVPNGAHPGAGVRVGGQPAAYAAALQRLQQFLAAEGLAR